MSSAPFRSRSTEREKKKGPGATRSPSLSPSARHSLISFNSPVSSVAGGSRKAPGRKKGGGVLSDVVTRSMLSQWTSLSPELSTKVPQLGDSSQARLKASARRLLGTRKDDDTNSCQRRRFFAWRLRGRFIRYSVQLLVSAFRRADAVKTMLLRFRILFFFSLWLVFLKKKKKKQTEKNRLSVFVVVAGGVTGVERSPLRGILLLSEG